MENNYNIWFFVLLYVIRVETAGAQIRVEP